MTTPRSTRPPMVAALVYATLGLVVFAVAFVVVDRLIAVPLWKEIEDDQNTALAILMGLDQPRHLDHHRPRPSG